MIPYDRRRLWLVTLGALAIFVGGTALAARRSLSPTIRASAARLNEKARQILGIKVLQSPSPAASVSFITPAQASADAKPARRQFTVYRNPEGETVCRQATPAEIAQREQADAEGLGLRKINHLEIPDGKSSTSQSPAATNLIIVLRATQQLQQNQAATAAFNRAAQNWESLIMSPVTIYIDVDFGTTNFGQTWPAGVLGATSAPGGSYPYQSVRANLIAEATGEGNATKQAIFNALPSNSVPTDLGDASATDVSDSSARAIGLLPATAQPTDTAARIAFNSNFTFDFDPSDGITASAIDFDAVATHEIGHALGFDSDAGLNVARPSVWDLYRFRTGTTSSTFTTAQRVMTIGGSPDPLQYDFIPGNTEIGLSTGGPAGSSANGADGWQSSHWKHVASCVGAIGIMDPAIPNGCRRSITSNDTLALTSFGYNLTNTNPPPPPPPAPTPPTNDNFANAQSISGCSGSVSGSSFRATSEAGEPSHDPPDTSSLSPTHTVWYQWQAPSSGSTTITTSGSDFDTILAVYMGSSVGSLTRLVFNDDVQDGVITTSTVTFNAAAGTTYRIVVDGWGGDAGTVKLNWTGCGAPNPTPTPTPTPTATPTPTPTPTPTVTPTPTPTPVSGPCPGGAGFTVNDTGDAGDLTPGDGACKTAGGVCTLRAAIQEENAMSGCGTMDLNLTFVTGTISLATPLPDIHVHTNIKGPGATQLTIQRSSSSGTPNFRIFTIDGNWSVTMAGLTVSNGNAGNDDGGGVLNLGSLTMTNCNVYGNVAGNRGGGIFTIGGVSLTMVDCNVGANGPGQPNVAAFGAGLGSSGGTVKIRGGSISGNDVGTSLSGGGGIGITGGGLILDGVAITNNKSNGGGGGLKILSGSPFSNPSGLIMTNCLVANNGGGGSGGGLFVNAGNINFGNVVISNSTISGNTSFDGGGISNAGGISVINSTITDNRTTQSGTGIVTCDSCTILRNSIVARNLQGGIPNTTAGDIFGRVDPTSSFNLVGACNSCGLTSGLSNNQVGVSDPRIGALANNGGSSMTHALLAGSPAIDAGNNSLALSADGFQLTSDQRGVGFNRVIGGTVDIGAFEVQTAPQQNLIDQPDFFVKQQYLDFLNRQPDQSGLNFWTNQITSCGSNTSCVEEKRINVSAAFFLSIEFQQTGNLVYKMYKAGFGNLPGKPVPVNRASFGNDTILIQSDPARIIVGQAGWEAQLDFNKQVFAVEFVERSSFQSAHAGQDAGTYISSLFANAGVTPTAIETSAAINAFNSAGGGDVGRASALRSVAESNSVSNKLFNEAFVLMQYFGYLQRNPYDPPEPTLDYQGYNFWLNKLNQFNGNYINAEMVKAFISSTEYRQRFGP